MRPIREDRKAHAAVPQYELVTEGPGKPATPEELAMLATRYQLAAELAQGQDVLELACGPGMGLGLLAARARRVVGSDYDGRLLQEARRHYGRRMPLLQLDAQCLPFREAAFDVLLLFEAIYYLGDVDAFLTEARRVLRPDGRLVICSANKECSSFHPSPFSVAYYSARQLDALLRRHGFAVEVQAAFPVRPALLRNSRRAGRWLANLLGLSPGAKRVIKRLLLRERLTFPAELREGADVAPRVALADMSHASAYQVLFATGRLS